MLGIASTGAAGVPAPPNGEDTKDKVTICHATRSLTNPYVMETVNTNAIINQVSGKVQGHGKHEGDVIPEFSIPRSTPQNPPGLMWTYPGMNVPEGQKLLDNKCYPLDIVKTGTPTVLPGGLIKYQVAVTNVGLQSVPFAAVKVYDKYVTLVPPDVTTAMKPGETRVWTGERVVKDSLKMCGKDVENTATVMLKKPPRGESSRRKRANGDGPMGDSSTWMTSVICPLDVAISKTPTQATVEPGGTVGYQVAVTNTGPLPVPTASIMVADEGATLTPPVDPPKYLEPGTSLLWGASKAVAADTSVCGTTVQNTASVKLELDEKGPKYTFTPGADDVATAVGIPVSGGICPVVTPASIPAAPVTAFRPASPAALSVTKTGPARALRGGFVNFRLTVTNTGGATATGVTLSDTPARAMQWRAVPSGAKVLGSTASWTIGDLAAGQSVSKVVRLRMRPTANGRSCNTAVATATGLDQAQARACVTVVAARRPATPVTG